MSEETTTSTESTETALSTQNPGVTAALLQLEQMKASFELSKEADLRRFEQQKESDADRKAHEVAQGARQTKAEMIKVATEMLTANAKSKPVNEREVTAEDITAFAAKLTEYVG
jgi:hypothetical protein